MKQIKSSALALLLAGSMAISMAGCSDTTWAAECDGVKMPAGVYINNVMSAYTDGYNALPADANFDNIWNNSIDGADFQTWVRNRAMEYTRTYFAVEKKFDEMGLVLEGEDKAEADYMASYQWSYYGSIYEENGISEASFTESIYNSYKASMLFEAIYGEGGTEEVPDQELLDHFNANYISADRIVIEPTVGDDGTISEDALKEAAEKAEGYKIRIENGESIGALAKEYSNELAVAAGEEASDEEVETSSVVSINNSGYDEAFISELKAAAVGEPVVIESDTYVYVMIVNEVTTDSETFTLNEPYLLSELKGEEFDERLAQWGNELSITFNEAAVTRYDPKKLKL